MSAPGDGGGLCTPAVSYTRFSDPSKQANGDSQDRQDRAFLDFCARFDLTPDTRPRGASGSSGVGDALGASSPTPLPPQRR
jgi:hypothetical protein